MHAAEDKNKQEFIEAKNAADTLIYASEKTLKEAGDKIKPEEKKEIEDKINVLKETQKSDNIETIREKTKELSDTIQKVGSELYKQQSKPEDKPKDEGKDSAEEGKYSEK